MGMLKTNTIPPNPSHNPNWEAMAEAEAEKVVEAELPGEQAYRMLRDCDNTLFVSDGSRLYRFLLFEGSAVLVKDPVTGEPGVMKILGRETLRRLKAECEFQVEKKSH